MKSLPEESDCSSLFFLRTGQANILFPSSMGNHASLRLSDYLTIRTPAVTPHASLQPSDYLTMRLFDSHCGSKSSFHCALSPTVQINCGLDDSDHAKFPQNKPF